MIFRKIRRIRRNLREAEFYDTLIPKGSLCFDVGANDGDRSATLIKVGLKVIAVEPQTSCVQKLSERFINNPELQILQIALGEFPGTENIYLCDEYSECSTMSNQFIQTYSKKSNLHWGRMEQVKVNTLDNLILDHGLPNYIKLDVEGYELQVLKGLSHAVDLISIEFNLPLLELSMNCFDIISSLGDYQCNFIQYENFNWMLKDWKSASCKDEILSFIRENSIDTGEIFFKLKTPAFVKQ